jgi:hypothetical protein
MELSEKKSSYAGAMATRAGLENTAAPVKKGAMGRRGRCARHESVITIVSLPMRERR